MAKEKLTLLDWLGLRRSPNFSRARWLGGLIGVTVLGGALGVVGFRLFMAFAGLDNFADASR